MKYIIIDTHNLFYRAVHVAHRGADADERADFAVHLILQSLGSAWRKQGADHVVVCLDTRSWRNDYYPPYKAPRRVLAAAATEQEKEQMEKFNDALSALIKFFDEHTNVTVMREQGLEADDLIAGWVQMHPDDEHVIVSSDSDFHQLLAPNVTQFNGVTNELYTINGVFDEKGKAKVDKKTKNPVVIDPQWALFEKCIRGDSSDNIFSAYPGVRTKGSKNKVGLLEAYADKENKGYAWNNLMLQRFMHHDGTEHRVIDDYNRNVMLVDLSAQPEEIRAQITETIAKAAVKKSRPLVGIAFMKLCARFGLEKLSNQSQLFATMLTASYPEGDTNV